MHGRRPPRATRAGLAAAVAALGIGGWMTYDGVRVQTPPRPSVADALTARPGSAHSTSGPDATAMTFSPPVRIRIPSIGVDAPVVALGADTAGHLRVPPEDDRNLAGWYRDGASPGAAGNAVMDGHVDTPRGRAVFYGLGALHKGATVSVTRADRSTAEFSVYGIEVYAKDAFPDERVYGPTSKPELRLLTCGGGHTKATGYLGNVVVYARLVKSLRP
ncbi:class F sortase [Streptomyces sp.]|uniref:class F sortase n=1 Tax=Streptomyces sp. TaxID=1931 RepID=UPI002F3FE24E